MSHAAAIPNQVPANQGQQGSAMMRYYLTAEPSTTTERLAQGRIKSDQEIEDSLEQKKSDLDALVRQAMGGSSQRP
ncbi:hypothetical protein F4806DRAFT_182502 [Annulohypoxylon nitens]|nr:hypothetical protein F4806DRAFT_182502 [Annulohypoxylon nitens]KAI1441048.1 hypothetical protein F5Y02DRAFT_318274 [Annulohypoxylon stygium]